MVHAQNEYANDIGSQTLINQTEQHFFIQINTTW
jgi:hypothetical protein